MSPRRNTRLLLFFACVAGSVGMIVLLAEPETQSEVDARASTNESSPRVVESPMEGEPGSQLKGSPQAPKRLVDRDSGARGPQPIARPPAASGSEKKEEKELGQKRMKQGWLARAATVSADLVTEPSLLLACEDLNPSSIRFTQSQEDAVAALSRSWRVRLLEAFDAQTTAAHRELYQSIKGGRVVPADTASVMASPRFIQEKRRLLDRNERIKQRPVEPRSGGAVKSPLSPAQMDALAVQNTLLSSTASVIVHAGAGGEFYVVRNNEGLPRAANLQQARIALTLECLKQMGAVFMSFGAVEQHRVDKVLDQYLDLAQR